jgi:hypothetical protein
MWFFRGKTRKITGQIRLPGTFFKKNHRKSKQNGAAAPYRGVEEIL